MKHEEASNGVHKWNPKTPLWIKSLGIFIVAVNLVFIVVALDAANGDWAILIPIAGMLAGALLGALLMFSRIFISIDTTQVRTGLWPLSERVFPISQVERHSVLPNVKPSSFGGVGFRKAPGNRTGYLWNAGVGLELQKADGESVTIVFDEAEEASRILDDLIWQSNHGTI